MNIQDIFELFNQLKKDNNSTFLKIITDRTIVKSYAAFIRYFNELDCISEYNLVIGINFVYGWMPTMFHFRAGNFNEAVEILNKTKRGEDLLTVEDLLCLKNLFNNSMVGTSKLLHFVNPEKYPIIDSRIIDVLRKKNLCDENFPIRPNANHYLQYQKSCLEVIRERDFNEIHKKIRKTVNFDITKLRSLELILYSYGRIMNH